MAGQWWNWGTAKAAGVFVILGLLGWAWKLISESMSRHARPAVDSKIDMVMEKFKRRGSRPKEALDPEAIKVTAVPTSIAAGDDARSLTSMLLVLHLEFPARGPERAEVPCSWRWHGPEVEDIAFACLNCGSACETWDGRYLNLPGIRVIIACPLCKEYAATLQSPPVFWQKVRSAIYGAAHKRGLPIPPPIEPEAPAAG